ncbi:hypothetical protein BaRGS_00005469 [Batillaria attramentaria]|uniref:Uncharacterized protein n=1 Tax=Batillaria attramentaria TaxID=370345 RepID=A0ABD0LUD6_9CAEN
MASSPSGLADVSVPCVEVRDVWWVQLRPWTYTGRKHALLKATSYVMHATCFHLLPGLAGHSQQTMKEASTCTSSPAEMCGPSSTMLIRTAKYKNTTSSAGSGQCKNRTCSGSECGMGSQDLLRVYRKCGDNTTYCDLSSTRVTRDFEISYYCLNNLEGAYVKVAAALMYDAAAIRDPCDNVTWSGNAISLLVDYSRYSRSRDLTCQCVVTTPGHNSSTIVRGLHLYEEETANGRGSYIWHAPSVTIGYGEWEWGVIKPVPRQWQLSRKGENISVLFEHAHGATFGRTWIYVQGEDLQLNCHYTSQETGYVPPDSMVSSTAGTDRQQRGQGTGAGPSLIYIAVGVASSAALILVVVSVVLVAKCRHPKSARPENVSHKQRSCQVNTVARAGDSLNRGEGEYCTITDLTPPAVDGAHTSHDRHPAANLELQERGQRAVVANGRHTNGAVPHSPSTSGSRQAETPREAGASAVGQRHQSPGGGFFFVGGSSEYESLCHRPGQTLSRATAQVPIYDHAGNFHNLRSADGEEVYNKLQRGTQQTLVIDNVYDTCTTTFV